jgi:hypothetical protein
MKYLLHKLFGWEYWAVNYGFTTSVARAYYYKDGTRYVKIHGTHILVGKDGGYRNWKQVY